MKENTLAQVLPPGDILKNILDSRGWTQADLAEILGRPPRLISEIVGAKRTVTPETAHGLGEAFGTGAEFWLNLEGLYQLSKLQTTNDAVAKRARIFGQFPVKEMQKRGWIKHATQLADIEHELINFFGVPSLDEAIAIPHAAKKTSYDKVTAVQAAWLARAKQLAPTVLVKKYSPNNLQKLFTKLRDCIADPRDSAKVPELLSEAGIRLLVIESLPGSKIDAACFWLSENEPVIVLTLRFDRHDIFWHALLHELDHIEHAEGKSEPVVDTNLMADCSHGAHTEKRANATAAGKLIPDEQFKTFIARVTPFYSDAQIVGFANDLKIHPGIVVGQLQHKGLVPFSTSNRLKSKIREVLTKTAVKDGFEV